MHGTFVGAGIYLCGLEYIASGYAAGPESTEVIPLDEDYRSFRYEVRLDYPEYVRLTATEAERVAVWGKDLPENPDVNCQVAVSRKRGVLDVAFAASYGVEGNIIS